MPTYEYRCSECDTETTRSMTMDEYDKSEGLTCEQCGAALKRTWSPPGIEIK